LAYLRRIPPKRVGQIHLAGHSTHWTPEGQKYLIDTHDHPICEEVWDLYGAAVRQFGKINTMVEWDAHIPEYKVLEGEILKARKIEESIHAKQPQGLILPSESFHAEHPQGITLASESFHAEHPQGITLASESFHAEHPQSLILASPTSN
jgi:hypothetical protein